MPNLNHKMSVTLGNMSNLGFMNCQTKVVIQDLNCDFRMNKQNYNQKTKLLDIFWVKI
jgi:hypothetical protein